LKVRAWRELFLASRREFIRDQSKRLRQEFLPAAVFYRVAMASRDKRLDEIGFSTNVRAGMIISPLETAFLA
jgi:hypothetical protein